MWRCSRILVAVLFILAMARDSGVQLSSLHHYRVDAAPGESVTLPCYLERLERAPDKMVQWFRFELPEGAKYVHLWRDGVDGKDQLPSYIGRTKQLDAEPGKDYVVLQLLKVISDDNGVYKCCGDETDCWSTVTLTVGSNWKLSGDRQGASNEAPAVGCKGADVIWFITTMVLLFIVSALI